MDTLFQFEIDFYDPVLHQSWIVEPLFDGTYGEIIQFAVTRGYGEIHGPDLSAFQDLYPNL